MIVTYLVVKAKSSYIAIIGCDLVHNAHDLIILCLVPCPMKFVCPKANGSPGGIGITSIQALHPWVNQTRLLEAPSSAYVESKQRKPDPM